MPSSGTAGSKSEGGWMNEVVERRLSGGKSLRAAAAVSATEMPSALRYFASHGLDARK